jgi:uncharacterized protein involved in exopolysaccharide biosynthesis
MKPYDMSIKPKHSDEAFNIKDFILSAVNYKYYFLASIIVFLSLAYAYNNFIPTTYQVNSTIGPVEDRRSSLLELNDNYNGTGNQGQPINIENDMNSLKSFSLVSETIKELGLEISYYKQPLKFLSNPSLNHINSPNQIYGNNEYTIKIDKSHPQAINTRFYIDIIDKNKFRLSASDNKVSIYNYLDNRVISNNNIIEFDTIFNFNQTIISPYFKFSVGLNKEFYKESLRNGDHAAFFKFNHLDIITRRYLGRLVIEPVSLRSTLINVNLQGKNLNLTVDFINHYLQAFLNNNLSKKNNIAYNTVNFIDSQLSEISDSLIKSESKLRDYRAINQVTDLTYQGQQAIAQLTEVENDISTLKMQEKYNKYILDYFKENQDIAGLAPPSAANVIDPIMNTMILELLELNAEKSTILSNKAEKSLFLGQIENKIKLQKQSIIENIKNNLNAMELTMNELNYRHNKLSREISRLPKTELNMVSMQRQFNITDAMYTFLLQKRSEAAISMASNIPDYEILEPARHVTSSIISPKSTLNYLLSIFHHSF